jgi:hypothetical protein
VDRITFDAARDRVGSYKNLLVSIKPGEVKDFEAAVRERLADCARRLSGSSTSFSLPAWGSVAKQLTDERNPKSWLTVFARRRGLIGARMSVWENVTPAGTTGGAPFVTFSRKGSTRPPRCSNSRRSASRPGNGAASRASGPNSPRPP